MSLLNRTKNFKLNLFLIIKSTFGQTLSLESMIFSKQKSLILFTPCFCRYYFEKLKKQHNSNEVINIRDTETLKNNERSLFNDDFMKFLLF